MSEERRISRFPVARLDEGNAEEMSERDEAQGARSAATETYQLDRRGSEHRATQRFARAANYSAFPELPEDIRTRIVAVQEKTGFIPNVFLALAHRPEEFRAFFAYHDALMEKYSMSNRIANMSALRPNDEFYAMGRT